MVLVGFPCAGYITPGPTRTTGPKIWVRDRRQNPLASRESKSARGLTGKIRLRASVQNPAGPRPKDFRNIPISDFELPCTTSFRPLNLSDMATWYPTTPEDLVRNQARVVHFYLCDPVPTEKGLGLARRMAGMLKVRACPQGPGKV